MNTPTSKDYHIFVQRTKLFIDYFRMIVRQDDPTFLKLEALYNDFINGSSQIGSDYFKVNFDYTIPKDYKALEEKLFDTYLDEINQDSINEIVQFTSRMNIDETRTPVIVPINYQDTERVAVMEITQDYLVNRLPFLKKYKVSTNGDSIVGQMDNTFENVTPNFKLKEDTVRYTIEKASFSSNVTVKNDTEKGLLTIQIKNNSNIIVNDVEVNGGLEVKVGVMCIGGEPSEAELEQLREKIGGIIRGAINETIGKVLQMSTDKTNTYFTIDYSGSDFVPTAQLDYIFSNLNQKLFELEEKCEDLGISIYGRY